MSRYGRIPLVAALLLFAALLASGCQAREFASRLLNRDEEPKRSEELLVPTTDANIEQGKAEGAAQGQATSPDATPPEIIIWEGSTQDFAFDSAQRWLNVQGKALDPETGIQSLQYVVNESSQMLPLEIGPSHRRLAGIGDFNIELDASALVEGVNILTIAAVNGAGLRSSTTIDIVYNPAKDWPLPYAIDWSAVDDLQKVTQVVDGLWEVTPQGVRTAQVGYDRVLAIGGLDWQDYEVTVPVTVHAVDERAYLHRFSANPGFGVNLRWTGHTDDPPVCEAMHCGWNPTGASNWFEFRKDQPALLKLIAEPPKGEELLETSFELGQVYWMKARAETNDGGTLYSLKFWKDGASEPQQWTLTRQAEGENLSAGSFLLVAHHVDITFGNLSAVPLP